MKYVAYENYKSTDGSHGQPQLGGALQAGV